MKAGWETKRLAAVAIKITDGSHNPPKGGAISNYLMLSSKNVFDDDLHFAEPRYLTEEQHQQEDKRTGITDGDVLLTIVGTIGRSAVVPTDVPQITLQRSVAVIRPKKEIVEPRFMMYSFIERNEELNKKARGVAQKGIYLETLRELEIKFPSLVEQRRIATLLDEAFADIATAKANAEKNLQNARELFNSHLHAIFVHAQENGEIVALSELATDITDGDHMPPPKVEHGLPFITIGNIDKQTRTIDFSDTFKVSREYFDALKANKKPMRGDVLFTVTGSFGIPVLVEDDTEFCFQRHIGLIRPKAEVDSTWLHYLLQSPQVFNQAADGATGTAQKTVSLKVLRNLQVPRISLKAQSAHVETLGSVETECRRLESIYRQKLTALDDLKKSLLHQAFSGQL